MEAALAGELAVPGSAVEVAVAGELPIPGSAVEAATAAASSPPPAVASVREVQRRHPVRRRGRT